MWLEERGANMSPKWEDQTGKYKYPVVSSKKVGVVFFPGAVACRSKLWLWKKDYAKKRVCNKKPMK